MTFFFSTFTKRNVRFFSLQSLLFLLTIVELKSPALSDGDPESTAAFFYDSFPDVTSPHTTREYTYYGLCAAAYWSVYTLSELPPVWLPLYLKDNYRISSVIRHSFFLPKQSKSSRSIL